jgi:phage FluMu protein gp41
MSDQTHTIELAVGYQARGGKGEPEGERHTRVTFGKRLTGADLMNAHDDPQSNVPTQYKLLLLRAGITKFGSLPTPVTLLALLSLDSVDIEDLAAANNEFLSKTQEGHAAEFVSDSEVKLPFGFSSQGLTYNRVLFGRRITGLDMVAAEKKGYGELRRECYLIGREIAQLSTEDHVHTLDGPVEVQVFEALDGHDITVLRTASAIWRDSFRNGRGGLQKPDGAERDAAG